MKTRNHIQLIGYLGKDPRIVPCRNGNTLVMLKIATHSKRRQPERADPDAKFSTTWHLVKFFNANADHNAATCIKGSHVMIEGKLENGSYIDQQGRQQYFSHVRAYHLTDLDR